VAGLELPKTLPEDDPEAEPNKLGFPAPPKLPNGEVDEAASLAKPELANAEADAGLGSSFLLLVNSFSTTSMLDRGDALAERGSWLSVLPLVAIAGLFGFLTTSSFPPCTVDALAWRSRGRFFSGSDRFVLLWTAVLAAFPGAASSGASATSLFSSSSS
jgi:hypothetical protein